MKALGKKYNELSINEKINAKRTFYLFLNARIEYKPEYKKFLKWIKYPIDIKAYSNPFFKW